METKIINILRFLRVAFVNQTWDILALYISFIFTFALKRYISLKRSIFSVLIMGFYGDTFVARQHNTDGIFHFSLKF